MVVNTACVTMTEKDGGSVDATASAGNNGKSSSCSQEKAGGACILFEVVEQQHCSLHVCDYAVRRDLLKICCNRKH